MNIRAKKRRIDVLGHLLDRDDARRALLRNWSPAGQCSGKGGAAQRRIVIAGVLTTIPILMRLPNELK